MLDERRHMKKTSSNASSASSASSLVSGSSSPSTRLLSRPIRSPHPSFKGRASPSPRRNLPLPLANDGLMRRSSLPISSPNLLSVATSDDDIHAIVTKDRPIRRVRSFKTTSKGAVVNRGDSFRAKAPVDKTNVLTPDKQSVEKLNLSHSNISQISQVAVNPVPSSYFKVLMLGSSGVGKSALTSQFLTSEYIGAFDSVNVSNTEEKTVSIQLNGEESTIEFMDPSYQEVDLEGLRVDAYVVVFSIAHPETFEVASDTLKELRNGLGTDRAVLLVGNKTDLVRKRKISNSVGKSTASQFDCIYLETSAALNHHVDELLVEILSEIRLQLNLPPLKSSGSGKRFRSKKQFLNSPMKLLRRIFSRKSKR